MPGPGGLKSGGPGGLKGGGPSGLKGGGGPGGLKSGGPGGLKGGTPGTTPGGSPAGAVPACPAWPAHMVVVQGRAAVAGASAPAVPKRGRRAELLGRPVVRPAAAEPRVGPACTAAEGELHRGPGPIRVADVARQA
ncbi:hypothetical protein Srufu_021440 [Streptomyces libani subsp. rufus]|nr:hypothetical protein Srufu_021440 [Streptomyces libani subsp. rufus]